MMARPLQIEILPERFWRPRIAGTDCRAGTGRLHGLLMAIHGRHAALTPSAAARILDGQSGLPRQPWRPWEEMRGLVGKAIDAGGDPGARFWSEISPALLYSRALVPIVHAVSRKIGRSYLFGMAASPAAARAETDYDGYQASFDAELERFLSDQHRMGTAFWDGLAFSLWSEFLQRSGSRIDHARPHDPVPDADPGVIHWLRRLAPAFASDARHRPRIVHHRTNPRQPRPKQGGVTGVRMSHTPDDLPDRLASEAVYPAILQLDRLLHTGYLVRHRPPPLDRRRDILVLGLFPGSRLVAGYSLASAAWLDAAMRAAILMRRASLLRSDIAAAAATAADGAAVARVSLASLGWLDRADPWTAGARERFDFLRSAGCLPGFLDRGPGLALAPVEEADPVYDGSLPDGMGAWLRRVIAAKPFLRAGPGDDRAGVLAQYSAVHVQLVVPDAVPDAGEPDASAAMVRDLLHRIRSDLGLHEPGHTVSLFCVSRRPLARFSIHTGLRPAPAVHDAATPDDDAFTGALISGMIDCMLGMAHG